MATILEKVSTLISANLFALVDQTLKTNSMALIDQYIRQVEDQLDNLEDAATLVGGEVRTVRRRLEDQKRKSDELDQAVDGFLKAGNDASAAASQSRLNSMRQLVETYADQLERQEAEYQKLLDARTRLQGRLETTRQQRSELQALLDLARSKETVAKSMKGLDELMGSGDSEISLIANRIYNRLDTASSTIAWVDSNLDDQVNEMLERKVIDAQLAERKKRLALK